MLGWLNSQPGCRAIKTHGDERRSGEPDIMACWNGRTVMIEVKKLGKEPTPLQYAVMDLWRKAGAISFWATSLQELKNVLIDEGLVDIY